MTLRIAVPNKGSLSESSIQMLKEAGYRQRGDVRDLVFIDPDNDVEFYYLRPRDIAIYVGSGELEAGITGRDLLIDSGAKAQEILALDFGPMPKNELRETLWTKGMRLVTDPTGRYLRPEDFSVGSLVSAHPENLHAWEEENHNLNARAKTSILVVRMTPEQLRTSQGEGWDYQGIIAYSKICTHVGCPIALYEHRTHHLLCPCHQSTFDLADSGNVVFGPAARRLPQLPLGVDEEGYLVALSDFQEPIGPSFWER